MRNKNLSVYCSVTLCFVLSQVSRAQEVETLRLKSGGPIEATLLSWNFQDGTLTVRLADGLARELAANELHSSDMKRIERFLAKQMLAGRKFGSQSESTLLSPGSASRSKPQPANGFPNGSAAFSQSRGVASGNGSAMASGSAGGFAFSFGGAKGNSQKDQASDSPGNPSGSSELSAEGNNFDSVFSSMLNINGNIMRFESPEEFDRAMQQFRKPRR